MRFDKLSVNSKATHLNQRAERVAGTLARGLDNALSALHLGGRKAAYDDHSYEFIGGAKDGLRKKHYDKSLRLLWKAEHGAPWSSFRDCTTEERRLHELADDALSEAEKVERARITSDEFAAMLDREYTVAEKQAIVDVLSAIGHGEAYAWLVSADVLGQVQSTGARAALTMQVLEEAKHFVVLRELLQAFRVPIPPLSGWEYMFLERVHKARGLDKLFGMNVVVEGIALALFGMMSHLPGLEILRLFHLDEARHTALPVNYFAEFPLTRWQRRNPLRRLQRTRIILPAIPLIFYLEKPLAELGIDVLHLAGSVSRKISNLAERSGFDMLIENEDFTTGMNSILNAYARWTRQGHEDCDFMVAETTKGARERAVEAEIFGDDQTARELASAV